MHKHHYRIADAREFTFARCECGAMIWQPKSRQRNGVTITDIEPPAGMVLGGA